MQKTYINQSISHVKDQSKGQKIVAALYLVTNHLPVHDPLVVAIRTNAVSLLTTSNTQDFVTNIVNLLHSARFAGVMNEQNVSILVRELETFSSTVQQTITTLFTDNAMSFSSSSVNKSVSNTYRTVKDNYKNQVVINENKNKRQADILSFITTRKSAGIKDIAALFPDVSEKTIQRELGNMVESGKITKRGSKRWSIYLAV